MSVEKPKRGMLTNEAMGCYREATGRELTQVELRLIPFIQYTVINEGTFDGKKVNNKELAVLDDLENAGLIEYCREYGRPGMFRIVVSGKYWNAMCDVLKICYVARWRI